MREPITKLAIVPIASIDSTIVEQLAPSLRAFSLLGGGNESPIIFFVARVVRKTSRHQNEKRILLVTLKHVLLYDEKGAQTRALYVPEIQRLILCQDGFVVFKIAKEHDLVIRLEDSAFIDYFVNILKVLNLHFHVGSPIAGGDVGASASRRPSSARLLEVQGSQVSYDQLTGGNKVNLSHDAKATSARNGLVSIPSILNIDAAKQDFLSALMFIPPPPKRTTAASGAPLVVQSPSDVAAAESVLRHPLFHPPSLAAAGGTAANAEPAQSKRGTAAVNNDASTSPLALPAPAPGGRQDVATPVTASTAGAVTVRSIATIDRQDDDAFASPVMDEAHGSSARRMMERRGPAVEPPWRSADPSPPPPPPPAVGSASTNASPIQRLLSHHSADYHEARSLGRRVPSHGDEGAIAASLASSFAAVEHPRAEFISDPRHRASGGSAPSAHLVSLRDRVEAFCKLYDPLSLDDVDWWVATYEGREEACLEALHRKLASRELVKSSRRAGDLPMGGGDGASRVVAPPTPTNQHVWTGAADTSSNETSITQRLRALEEENRLLRERVASNGKSTAARGDGDAWGTNTTIHKNAGHRSDDNHNYVLNARLSMPTNDEPRTRHDDVEPYDSRRPTTHGFNSFDGSNNNFGSMEAFESSIAQRSASDRVVLRQHRIDEMRREVHEHLKRNESATQRETRPLIRVGLLQDEIVVLIGRQQADQAAAQADRDETEAEAAAANERLRHAHSNSATSSSLHNTKDMPWGIRNTTHPPSNPPHPRTPAVQPHHEDPQYAQWYYTEYLPRMMYAGGHRQVGHVRSTPPPPSTTAQQSDRR